ncbi:hypothetical protein [Sphingobium sp. Z007]|uniref:hypothetical protein n=1 Tax=Sphingobium sp. Z007 TaxID=627495 RepID=UPI0015963AB9|nr:hypothetical protein [Sphingobium sp. Z007]
MSLLHRIGEALYGPRWISEMARQKGINLRTMQRWAAGQSEGPPTLYAELADDLDEQAGLLRALAQDVRAHVAGQLGK